MIWQNAWAFAGLLLLALPVLIHLLSRKRAVLQKFPSLRFLDVTRLLPTRSPNLSDIPLLLVRVGILAAATFALAQPLLLSAGRKQSLNSSLARAIIVDTSRSMMRASAAATMADSARVLAEQLATEASASAVMQTANVAGALPGADAWLAMQAGRSEVVLISDFQSGVIDSAMIARIPANYGVRLVSLASGGALNDGPWKTTNTSVTATREGRRTDAEWTNHNDSDPGVTLVQLFAFTSDQLMLRAAQDAAFRTTSPGMPDSLRPVGIVFRGAAEQAAFVRDAKVPDASWMANVLVSVRDNALLKSAAADEDVADTTISAPFAVVASNGRGAPVVYAAQGMSNGTKRLLFFQRGSPTDITAASLIAAVSNAVARPSTVSESVTSTLSDATIKSFERAPKEVSEQGAANERKASSNAGLSDGRWLWLVALILLGVETSMRRAAASRDVVLETA